MNIKDSDLDSLDLVALIQKFNEAKLFDHPEKVKMLEKLINAKTNSNKVKGVNHTVQVTQVATKWVLLNGQYISLNTDGSNDGPGYGHTLLEAAPLTPIYAPIVEAEGTRAKLTERMRILGYTEINITHNVSINIWYIDAHWFDERIYLAFKEYFALDWLRDPLTLTVEMITTMDRHTYQLILGMDPISIQLRKQSNQLYPGYVSEGYVPAKEQDHVKLDIMNPYKRVVDLPESDK